MWTGLNSILTKMANNSKVKKSQLMEKHITQIKTPVPFSKILTAIGLRNRLSHGIKQTTFTILVISTEMAYVPQVSLKQQLVSFTILMKMENCLRMQRLMQETQPMSLVRADGQLENPLFGIKQISSSLKMLIFIMVTKKGTLLRDFKPLMVTNFTLIKTDVKLKMKSFKLMVKPITLIKTMDVWLKINGPRSILVKLDLHHMITVLIISEMMVLL